MKKNELILLLQQDDSPDDIEVGFSPDNPTAYAVSIYSVNVIGLYDVNNKEILVLQSDKA